MWGTKQSSSVLEQVLGRMMVCTGLLYACPYAFSDETKAGSVQERIMRVVMVVVVGRKSMINTCNTAHQSEHKR